MPRHLDVMIVLDELDEDACVAAMVVANAVRPQQHPIYRYHREDLSFEGFHVVFVGPPPAPETLRRAMVQAVAVEVCATHRPDILSAGLAWRAEHDLGAAALNAAKPRSSAA